MGVEFAVLELLVAQFVEGQFALAAILVAALAAAHLKGQTFLSLFVLLHPLSLFLYLTLVLLWKMPLLLVQSLRLRSLLPLNKAV